jgi:4-amino-4-deoxy-L-arabinose transferase-like glycosyltransferase
MTDRSKLLPAGLLALVSAALAVYSQTHAFAWDEGWHLLAAQSITRGKHVYLDFCYPQTPLNAYWNAAWFRIFGDTWRTAHAVAAVMVLLAVLLTIDYLRRRFPAPGWRTPGAIAGIFLVATNAMIFRYGPIGQAYALCLFLVVAAFRATVSAADRRRPWLAAVAGFCACAAANATLLTAPVAPVLLVWMLWYNRAGSRWTKAALFAAAGAIPFLPLAWLYAHGPRQTIFSVIEYNLFYRQVEWEGAVAHDIGVLTAWINSLQSFVLGALAIIGLLFVRRSGWARGERAPFYLCALLAAAEILHIANAHPSFERYYMFAVPFLAILACAGLYAVAARIGVADRPLRPVALVSLLMCLGLGKFAFDLRENIDWRDMERIAHKVSEVTPPRAVLLADELIYFISRHAPPSGLELEDSHKFNLAAGVMARLHLISRPELDRRIKAGVFDTVEVWNEDKVDLGELERLYPQKAEIENATIFWGKVTH